MFTYTTAPLRKAGSFADAVRTESEGGCLDAFWLGQAGFAFRSGNALAVVDPYLSDALAVKYRGTLFPHARMRPPPFPPDEPLGTSFLLATHAHSDHLDPGSVGPFMAANPDCRLICPRSAADKAAERGAPAERIIFVNAGDNPRFDGFSVDVIASAHESVERDVRGDCLYLGYVMEMRGIRFYHSGDCVPYLGLDAELARRNVDVAFLPVNGRDAYRREHGVPGNFTIDEAAELCLAAGIRLLVPHHFGMFDFNTVGEDEIRRRLDDRRRSGLEYWLPDQENSLRLRPPA